jgi:hypothetical protein
MHQDSHGDRLLPERQAAAVVADGVRVPSIVMMDGRYLEQG